MNNFYFYNPTQIIFGKGEISKLPFLLKKYGKNVLLVYGKSSIKKIGLYSKVIELLKEEFNVFELSGVDPNPRIETVREGAEICKKNSIDVILAVGGGSTIDCSKGIAAGAKYEGDPWDFYSYKVQAKDALPIGTILTLSATGSEMNNGSVVTNFETNQKNGWGSPFTYPKFSILDPTYTFTVSKHQTACGVVDILTHIYEFYFNQNNVAELTDSISEAIMKNVIKYGKIAYDEPENYEARANIMWASSLALNGITKPGKDFEGFNHITEHALSALYDITHADGLALLAPNWMEYIVDENVEIFAKFARNVWDVNEEDDLKAAHLGILKVRELYEYLNMPLTLSSVNIDNPDYKKIADIAVTGKTLGQLRPLSKEDIINILKKAK